MSEGRAERNASRAEQVDDNGELPRENNTIDTVESKAVYLDAISSNDFVVEQQPNENSQLLNEHSGSIPTEIYLQTVFAEPERTHSPQTFGLVPESTISNSTDDHIYVLADTPATQANPTAQGTRTTKNTNVCEICQKVFNRFSNLTAHLTSHTKDFACYVCCNSYPSQFKLDRHMTHHSEGDLVQFRDNPAMVRCQGGVDECDAVFYSKFALYEHTKRHQNIVEYACDLCAKKFLTCRQLHTHKKRHGERAVCAVCGKVYASDKMLAQHLRLHSGEKPYECAVCKATFRFQSGLSVHEKMHTGVRNYKCGQCARTFARSNYLKEHMRIHFNEKPFRCEFCAATFTQKNVLKTHMAKKHRRCPVCERHVGDALQLRMHIWKVHPAAHGMLGLDETDSITGDGL